MDSWFPVFFISDGPEATRFGGINIIGEKRLKVEASTGLWIQRYMSLAIKYSDTPYYIKIDPDVEVLKRLDVSLSGDVCCVKKFTPYSSIKEWRPHGGVMAFSQSYIKKLLDIMLLEDNIYKNSRIYKEREELILGNIFIKTGAIISDRKDFCCGTLRAQERGEHSCFYHK